MVESIKNYIANLDPKDCVEDYKYEDRLNKCSICEALVGGLTCRYCGCFVLARAKKKDMNCPMPGCDKWK